MCVQGLAVGAWTNWAVANHNGAPLSPAILVHQHERRSNRPCQGTQSLYYGRAEYLIFWPARSSLGRRGRERRFGIYYTSLKSGRVGRAISHGQSGTSRARHSNVLRSGSTVDQAHCSKQRPLGARMAMQVCRPLWEERKYKLSVERNPDRQCWQRRTEDLNDAV